MPTVIPSAMAAKARVLRSGEWIYLYAIQTRLLATSGSQAGINEWVLLTNRGENVTFDGRTYYNWPIEHESIEADAEGSLGETQLKIGNFGDFAAAKIRDNAGLERMRILITTVHKDHLASPANSFTEDYDVQQADVTSLSVAVTIGQARLRLVKAPQNRFLRNGCRWKFRGEECAYSSHVDSAGVTQTHTTCDLTYDGPNGCWIKQNISRYGGFPNLPEFI